jgi:hypothetical protein
LHLPPVAIFIPQGCTQQQQGGGGNINHLHRRPCWSLNPTTSKA